MTTLGKLPKLTEEEKEEMKKCLPVLVNRLKKQGFNVQILNMTEEEIEESKPFYLRKNYKTE